MHCVQDIFHVGRTQSTEVMSRILTKTSSQKCFQKDCAIVVLWLCLFSSKTIILSERAVLKLKVFQEES